MTRAAGLSGSARRGEGGLVIRLGFLPPQEGSVPPSREASPEISWKPDVIPILILFIMRNIGQHG